VLVESFVVPSLGGVLWTAAHSRDGLTLLLAWGVLVGLVALLASLHLLGVVSGVALFGSVAYFAFEGR